MLMLLTGPPGTGKSTIAEAAAERLAAPVLGWDWVMAGLTPFPEMQDGLGRLDFRRRREVGWSMLWNLAIAQLRGGRPAILDGVARAEHIRRTRQIAADEGVPCLVVVTRCSDVALHRRRIEGRRRAIPGWYELDWDHVSGVLAYWTEPAGADLYLDAVDPLAASLSALRSLLDDAVSPTTTERR